MRPVPARQLNLHNTNIFTMRTLGGWKEAAAKLTEKGGKKQRKERAASRGDKSNLSWDSQEGGSSALISALERAGG